MGKKGILFEKDGLPTVIIEGDVLEEDENSSKIIKVEMLDTKTRQAKVVGCNRQGQAKPESIRYHVEYAVLECQYHKLNN